MVLAAAGVREWKMEQERAAALSGAQTAVLAETLTETEAESLPQIRTEAESQPQQLQEKKKIALTFDDGPHPYYTDQLLDGLAERGVKATFFLLGCNIDGNEEVVRRIAEEGHLIGNHTWYHVDITTLSQEEACAEIQNTSRKITEITGQPVEYVRPPFGN